jgi:hypothetical protein
MAIFRFCRLASHYFLRLFIFTINFTFMMCLSFVPLHSLDLTNKKKIIACMTQLYLREFFSS